MMDGDGTITDNRTGLMWVQSGYADEDTTPATTYTPSGNWRKYTWENAILYCERLDYAEYTDWRLPNVRELESIVDAGEQSPSINTTYFLNTENSWYWLSTTYVPTTTMAWYVGFTLGRVSPTAKTGSYYVRPVRGGP